MGRPTLLAALLLLINSFAELPAASPMEMRETLNQIQSAFNNESKNVILARKIPDQQATEMIRAGVFDARPFQHLLYAGKSLVLFEVVDSINDAPQVVVYGAAARRGRSFPDLGTPIFLPPDNSRWLLVYQSRWNRKTGSNVAEITLPDIYYSVFMEKPGNRLGVEFDALMADLKKIQQLKSIDFKSSNFQPKTQIGGEILKRLTRD